MKPGMIRSSLRFAIASTLLCTLCTTAFGATLRADDVIIADAEGQILRVDRDTGDRELLSGRLLGDGPDLGLPAGLAVDAHGLVYTYTSATLSSSGAMCTVDTASIFAIDPATGDRRLVASSLGVPRALTVLADGDLVVLTEFVGPFFRPFLLLRIDPATGDRSVLFDGVISGEVTGPDGVVGEFLNRLNAPAFVTTAPSGELYLATSSGIVLAIDPDTGDTSRVTVGGAGTTEEPNIRSIQGVAVGPAGTIAVLATRPVLDECRPITPGGDLPTLPACDVTHRVVLIDRATGDRTLHAELTLSPSLGRVGFASNSAGEIFLADDPEVGSRSVVKLVGVNGAVFPISDEAISRGHGGRFPRQITALSIAPAFLNPPEDADLDGRIDFFDNCSDVSNPGQEDADLDGLGDACDPFPESVNNELGQCQLELDDATASAPLDTDGDGEIDRSDSCNETRPDTRVDGNGCSLRQFCELQKRRDCARADFRNNEPRARFPRDCQRASGAHAAICVPNKSGRVGHKSANQAHRPGVRHRPGSRAK